MHKSTKLTTAAMLGALIVGASTSCSGSKSDLVLWTGFGASYTQAVNSLVERYKTSTGIVIDNQSQGSYDKLQTNINSSLSTASYPNFAHGYPDHFAGYIKSSIQVELDSYIKAYNEKHGVDLISDFYSEYMTENTTLKYDSSGKGYVMGLPFNKSTEVMGYNGAFVDYALTINPSLKIPETWQDFEEYGDDYLAVMDNLYGYYLYGKPVDGAFEKYTDWEVVKPGDSPVNPDVELVLDCSKVTKEKFRLICYDSSDNMFITIVRQWGSVYTSYTADDAKKYQHGWAEYYSGENKEKTKAALQFFKDLYDEQIFGLPIHVSDDSYSSTAFKGNQCMFVICSSGGLSYNVQTVPFRVSHVPYYDDGENVRKYVISQGTNLCLFDQGTDEDKQKAFDAMVALSTGEIQGSWAVETGYFPASKSATQTAAYQSLLNDEQESPVRHAYQDAAKLNESVYMNAETNWTKFVDPGFVGSSAIRAEVKTIMQIVCNGESSLDTILQESYDNIKQYTREGSN